MILTLTLTLTPVFLACLLVISLIVADSDVRCEFDILSASEINDDDSVFEQYRDKNQPLLLRGFLADWPLHDDFVEKYGDLKVLVGSESSIAYSHGSADTFLKLKNLASVPDIKHSESISFDLDILEKHPRIRNAYGVPSIFEPYFNDNLSAPVLSIGFAQSGLPLHTHGEAFLGLVSGVKRWLVYPPASGPSPALQKDWNPFLPTNNWLKRLASESDDGNGASVECVQRAGEVVYVPAGWAHSTFNLPSPAPTSPPSMLTPPQLDVVVGVGRQNTWLADDREAFSRRVLRQNPTDYDALKGVATSIFHRIFSLPSSTTGPSFRAAATPEDEAVALDEAVACLRTAISVRPSHPEVRILLVVILFRRGADYMAEALSEVGSLESLLDGLSASLGLEEGDTCMEEEACIQDRYRSGDSASKDAVQHNEEAQSSARGLASAFYRLALPLSAKDLLPDALRLLHKSIQLDDLNPKAHAQRVFLLQKTGKHNQALSALREMEAVTASTDEKGLLMLKKMEKLLRKES